MTKTKSIKQALLKFRKAGGILTMSQALESGIHRRTLYQLRDLGKIEKLSRGLYRLVDLPEPSLPDFIPIAKKVPKGVICLISALSFHGITTQIPHFVYVALPHKGKKPAIEHPPLRVFWFSEKLLTTGVEEHKLDGCVIKIFDVEKTLIDCLKFRNKIGMDIFIEALKIYWTTKNTNLDRLYQYAKTFRVLRILKPILETIVSFTEIK